MAFKRKKNEDARPKDELSDLEVHMKYWEFIFTRFIEEITGRVIKGLQDWQNIASRNILKVLVDSVFEEGKPWLEKFLEKIFQQKKDL